MPTFSPTPRKIFTVQLLSWLAIIWFYSTVSWPWILLSIVFYILYAGAGVALTFHRILSHGAFRVRPLMRKALIVLASYANVGSPITWVAVHRAHHRHCDTPKDPHSPQHMSWYYMLFGTMWSPVQLKYVAKDLLRDPFCAFVHHYYFAIQLPWVWFLLSAGGLKAVLACHIVPGGLTWLAGSLVNYLNHINGYVTNPVDDTSTNNPVTGFLVMGEGWHNNHHAHPTAPTTKQNWWEFDLLYHIGCLVGTPRKPN